MTTKTELISTIRKHCLSCCGGEAEQVRECTSGPDASPYSTCYLWPYRMGKDPNPSLGNVEAGKRRYEARTKAAEEEE